MWHKANKKLPKKTDYYLISNGIIYSVGIFDRLVNKFIDCKINNPILHEDIKYWMKIPMVPADKTNIPNALFN